MEFPQHPRKWGWHCFHLNISQNLIQPGHQAQAILQPELSGLICPVYNRKRSSPLEAHHRDELHFVRCLVSFPVCRA
jgi:hypothetical protein